jgi:uncharacterized membrane protein YoaK (UPF0700 family)
MDRLTLLCLTFVAGFVDTATFINAHGLFAAHVTGNFVVFGAALAEGVKPEDYIKLAAFPVFVIAVGLGVALYRKSNNNIVPVLIAQSLLMLAVGLSSLIALDAVPGMVLALTLVVAMGLQNSLHRYYPGPMSTVMTGTVMHWAASNAEKILALPPKPGKDIAAKPMMGRLMFCFALGCVAAGVGATAHGLAICIVASGIIAALAIHEWKLRKVKAA